MRYIHDFKLVRIEIYRQGIWTDMLDGILGENFYKTVRTWFHIEIHNGSDALKYINTNKNGNQMKNMI